MLEELRLHFVLHEKAIDGKYLPLPAYLNSAFALRSHIIRKAKNLRNAAHKESKKFSKPACFIIRVGRDVRACIFSSAPKPDGRVCHRDKFEITELSNIPVDLLDTREVSPILDVISNPELRFQTPLAPRSDDASAPSPGFTEDSLISTEPDGASPPEIEYPPGSPVYLPRSSPLWIF